MSLRPTWATEEDSVSKIKTRKKKIKTRKDTQGTRGDGSRKETEGVACQPGVAVALQKHNFRSTQVQPTVDLFYAEECSPEHGHGNHHLARHAVFL